jgi:hypothetical protein
VHCRLQKSSISPVKEDATKTSSGDSPNSVESVRGTPTRGTPPVAKANKDKQNRAKCLLQQRRLTRVANPLHQRVALQAGSSEFSLTGTESDMEMDYYDYNVQNASAVPNSYLGMDPAYLVWIPPATPTDSLKEDEDDDGETVVFEYAAADNKEVGSTGEVVTLQTLAGEEDIDEIKFADDEDEEEEDVA